MALDIFSKSGVSAFQFTRGNTYPIDHKYIPNSVKSISGGGTSKSIVNGSAQEFWSINLKNISDNETSSLVSFFSNTLVNWGEQLFTWTDHASTTRLVRLWDKNFAIKQIGADLNTIKIVLKVET